MDKREFDLVIIGGGPAGCAAALFLAGSGISVAIADRSELPVNKVCGDALSGMVVSVLRRMPGDVLKDFLAEEDKQPCIGIRFTAPGGRSLDLPFLAEKNKPDDAAPGYVMKRKSFDGFLLKEARKDPRVTLFSGFRVTGFHRENDRIFTDGAGGSLQSKMVIGADGIHSVTGRLLAGNSLNHKRSWLGARGYFRNVGGIQDHRYIELLFLKELLPGYLWIFPMADGTANVGLGLMQEKARKNKIIPAEMLAGLLKSHPLVRERFRNAELTGPVETHGLAPGPDPRKVSGERFLLAGDAASLVDPFTGEGIGNALASGEIAARIVREAFREQNFSASFLKKYDEQLRKKFFGELKTDQTIHRLAHYSFLFNFVVRKAIRNPELVDIFRNMYTMDEIRVLLTQPRFYLNLLFK